MDITIEYIEMCVKAKELQNEWIPSEGDWIDNTSANGGCYIFVNYKFQPSFDSPEWELEVKPKGKKPYLVCLFRQDQLQFIYANFIVEQLGYGNPYHFLQSAFIDFSRWLQNQYLPENFTCVPTNCFDTGEKLWLAFVMQEQFSKKWIDGDWR